MDLEAIHDVLDLYLWLRYQIFPLPALIFLSSRENQRFYEWYFVLSSCRHVFAECSVLCLLSTMALSLVYTHSKNY